MVKLNNDLSLRLHFPLGSYDLDQLQPPLSYPVAPVEATYPGIGKAAIDLTNSLVWANQNGFFGSPTADSTQAMMTPATTHTLVVVDAFNAYNAAKVQTMVNAARLTDLTDCTVHQQQVVTASTHFINASV